MWLNHVDNISPNGVLCHTIKPIPLMTRMSVALVLPKPSEHRIECEGIVVRCEPHESGDDHFKVAILFTKMGENDREAHLLLRRGGRREDLEASPAGAE